MYLQTWMNDAFSHQPVCAENWTPTMSLLVSTTDWTARLGWATRDVSSDPCEIFSKLLVSLWGNQRGRETKSPHKTLKTVF